MNDELSQHYRRWSEAEEMGREDAADAAFADVFRSSVRERAVAPDFVARTMAAVAQTAELDARRAHRIRNVLVPAAIVTALVGGYFSLGLIGSLLSAAVVGLLDLIGAAAVGAVDAVQTGAGIWVVFKALGRAAGSFITSPSVTATLLAAQIIAIAALIALQRLLGSDRESFR